MSNVHIREMLEGMYHAVYHIPIPAGNNAAGQPWQRCVVQSGYGGHTVLPDGDGSGTDGGISTAEKTQIQSGAVFEVEDVFDLMAGGSTGAQINATLDARYAAKQAEVQALVQGRLNQFGRVR